MKKFDLILIFSIMIFLLIGCSNARTIVKVNNASPETILKTNPDADIFIMNNVVYSNASDNEWVKKLTLNEGQALGKINKTGVKKDFKDWDATKLDVGTLIYELEGRKDLVLIKTDSKYRPYLKYVEG